MGRTPTDDLTEAVKDIAYVSVGLGVLAFQRLQVRRQELAKALSGSGGPAKGPIDALASMVGERVKLVEERLGASSDR